MPALPKMNPNPLLPVPDGERHPRTVLGAKVVKTALVSYVDESGRIVTQLAIVGDNNVHLLESRELGLTRETTVKGPASEWLKKGVLEILEPGKKHKKGS